MTTIPSIATLYNRILTAFQTVFGITIPAWGKNILRAISSVLSGEFKLQYLAIADLQKNLSILTCDHDMLLRYGFVKLKRFLFPATQGVYTATVTGTMGATIPAQTTFISDDSSENPGMLFILDTAFVLPGGSGIITIKALVFGTGSRLNVGDTLTATAPLINVSTSIAIASEVTIPNDAETDEQYRAKVVLGYQSMPSGDNAFSYREVGSLNVSGVQQIYPYATSGASNQVDLYIEAILADSIGPPFKGVPTPTITTDVTTAIEAFRPLSSGFQVNYYSIIPLDIDININMTGYPALTVPQQNIVKAALVQFLAKIRPFVPAADTIESRNDTLANFINLPSGVSGIIPAIAEALPGVGFGAVTFKVSGTPEVSYEFDNGEIPYLNGVTYI